RLEADEELERAGDAPIELARGDARLLVRVDRFRPEPVAQEPETKEEGQLALFGTFEEAPAPPAAPELPPPLALAAPPPHRVRPLSFTALSLFEQCAYKYYARYALGMSERPVDVEEAAGPSATEIGSSVHELLEQLDLSAPAVPELEDERIRG